MLLLSGIDGIINPNILDSKLWAAFKAYMNSMTGGIFFSMMSAINENDLYSTPFTALPSSFSGINTSFLEAKIQYSFYAYNLVYLPEVKIMSALLYPIMIGRWKTLPVHFTKRSGWQCYQLIYTHSGKGIMNLNHQIYHLTADSLFLLDCRPYHYFYSDQEGWEYSFIHFEGNSAAYLFEEIERQGLLFTNLKGTEIQRIYDLLVSLANKNRPDFDVMFHKHLTALLVNLISSKNAKAKMQFPEWLSEIHAYILEYYNKPLSIHELAQYAHLSDSRFAHIFTEFLGSSPIEYRDRLRIEHAKEYLVNTDLTVERISELVGYTTFSAFYAKFEKATGTTPGRYRKQHPKETPESENG